MVAIKKMRLPLFAEYTRLADLIYENDVWMNWSTALSWCEDEDPIHHALREACGGTACKAGAFIPDETRAETVGFRPAFEAETDIPDGQIVVVGTLFMDSNPVKIPVCLKDTAEYIPGAKLELREALTDENYQLRAIRAGDVLIADRIMLKSITWDECKGEIRHEKTTPMYSTPAKETLVKIKSVRLPSTQEWDRMIDNAVGVNSRVHWKGTYSWCLDEYLNNRSQRIVRGHYAGRWMSASKSGARTMSVGFRPVFIIEDPEGIPDGETVTVGTLYMDGHPVLANHNGDTNVPVYTPGTSLEFREPAEDPRYHVKSIKVGNMLIGDRVLLREISWDDLAKLGFCGDKISKGDTKMKKDTTIIYLGDNDYHTVACSKENEENVVAFLTKRYPELVKEYEGRDFILWCELVDTIYDLKNLTGDSNLRILAMDYVVAIRLKDEVYGDSTVLCSRKNEERVKAFLAKRYPKWSGNCVGKAGLTPWNDVLDAVEDMKELLGDKKMEFQFRCRDILIPRDPTKN